MANREIKTTLALDGEAKFRQGLQSVDREMRALASELGATTSAFGKGEASMEKCRAVGENLAKQVAQQKVKLDALKGAVKDSSAAYDRAVASYDEAVKSFGEGSEQARLAAKAVEKAEKAMDGYRVQCSNAEKKLNELAAAEKQNREEAEKLKKKHEQLEKQLKAVAAACATAAVKAAEIGKKTVVGAVDTAKKAFTAYTAAATAAGTAVAKLAADAALAADDINTLSTQTGLSTAEIQKFQYASDLIDVSVDTLTGSMAKLTKNMNTATNGSGDAASAFAALGVKITDENGQLRSNQEVFDEVIAALGKMENETQRDAYAMSILGKSAQELNPLIKGGADALKELGDSAESAGLILSQEALDRLNAYNNSLDTMKANSAAAGRVIAVSLTDSFKQITDVIGENIPGIAHQLASMFSGENAEEAAKEFRQTVTVIAEGVGKAVNEKLPQFLEVFNAVFSAIIEQVPSSVSAMLPPMIKGFTSLVKQLSAAFPKMLPEISKAAVSLFGGLLDGLNEAVSSIEAVMPEIIEGLSDAILEGIPLIISAAAKLLQGIVDTIGKSAPKLIGKIGEAIPKVASVIVDSLPKLITSVMEVAAGILKSISSTIPKIVGSIAEIIPAIVTAIVNGIPALLDGAITFLSAIVDALPVVVDSLLKALPDMVSTIVSKLVSMIPQIVEGAVKLFGGILQAIPQIVASLVQAIPQIVGAIVGGLLDGVGAVFNASLQLFGGVTTNADASLEAIKRNTEAISPFVDAMSEASPKVADFTGVLSEYGNTLSDIDSQINSTEKQITDVLASALKSQQGLRAEDLADLKSYIENLRKLEQEKLGIYQSQAAAELKKIELSAGTMTQEEMAQFLKNAETILAEANKSADSAYTSQLSIVENMHKAAGTTGSAAYQEDLEAAKAEYQKSIAENEKSYEAALATLMNSATQWVDGSFSEIYKISEEVNNKTSDALRNYSVDFADTFGHTSSQRQQYSALVAGLDLDSANAFLTMAARLKQEKGVLTTEARAAASEMLDSFDGLPGSFGGIATDAMRGMVKGLEEYIPALSGASSMSAEEIVSTLKKALDIHSPSKVTEEIGGYTVDGIVVGMEGRLSAAISVASEIGKSIAASLEKSLYEGIDGIDISAKISRLSTAASAVSGAAAAAGSTGTTTTSLTINNNSPKALTRYEEMRQAQRAVQLMGMIR